MASGPPTFFAPAPRLSGNPLEAQIGYFREAGTILRMLDIVSEGILILNAQRQAVFANAALYEFCTTTPENVLGRRFGEILNCQHHATAPGGCGTSRACSVCGAMKLILRAQQAHLSDSGVCSITTSDLDSREFKVKVTPHETEIGSFTFFTFTDISDANRRRALERVFFHDLLNTASGIHGVAQLLTENASEFSSIATHLANELIEEIESQRALLAAESGELEPALRPIETAHFLEGLAQIFVPYKSIQEKELQIQAEGAPAVFSSDPVLIRRVLINMVKNALEAPPSDGVVRLSAFAERAHIVFAVHNHAYMPPEVQLQVFKRSFSTKGEGRGIGTYSMRLFGEKYLGGRLSFDSTPEGGTTFRFALPLR